MFSHDDDVKDFNNYGGIKYKSPTEIDETYVRVNKISKSLLDELNAYLKTQWDERGEYAPSADIVKRNGGDAIYFDIVWGDWKHDHMRLWHLMNEFFRERGYVIERDMEVTDEDGSDTFSAEHYYTVQGDDEELNEWYGDHPDLKPLAGDACSAMGKLVQNLTDTNKDDWKEQVNKEDIEAMKHASDAAWLLYHYKNDGKVRPLKR